MSVLVAVVCLVVVAVVTGGGAGVGLQGVVLGGAVQMGVEGGCGHCLIGGRGYRWVGGCGLCVVGGTFPRQGGGGVSEGWGKRVATAGT